MPTKVLRRSQSTLVGTFNVFLCLGHLNLTHKKSSPIKFCQEKSSLHHVWVSKDILPVSCPQQSSGGLKGVLWALPTCFCALDMSICPTEKVIQPKPVRKKVSASCLSLQGCFASIIPTKVLGRSQRTLVGTFNMFLWFGHVNLSHKESSPTKTCEETSSLPHD